MEWVIALCCGVCVEDVGAVLGSSCDSWMWRCAVCINEDMLMIWLIA